MTMDLSGSQIQAHLDHQIASLLHAIPQSQQDDIVEFIYQRLTTSRYRRHSITPEYQAHIRQVISLSVANHQPIPLVWVFGCYKLWRLPESPLVDWAELFFLLHKIEWLKPILSTYKPGILFDFFADGTTVSLMNHLPQSDLDQYQESFLQLLEFINQRTPSNFRFTLHTLLGQYSSPQDFQQEFATNLIKTTEQYKSMPPQLTPAQKAIISMNVKSDHPLSEKEYLESQTIFDAFVLSSKRRPYYRTPEKIFLDSFAISNTLPIRTTRSSTVRFWIGAGVLRKNKGELIEEILSVTQLSQAKFHIYPVTINGLTGNNFHQIRLLSD